MAMVRAVETARTMRFWAYLLIAILRVLFGWFELWALSPCELYVRL